jgi:hypothetical protein
MRRGRCQGRLRGARDAQQQLLLVGLFVCTLVTLTDIRENQCNWYSETPWCSTFFAKAHCIFKS